MPFRDEFLSLAFYRSIAVNSFRIVLILVLAYLVIAASRGLIRRLRTYMVKVMLRARGGTEFELEKRATTVGDVARKSIAATVWVIAGIMILKEMNFDVRPLLAGAGVVGLAVGFGAQNLVKDVFAGFFILLDNQIRLNDVVVINGTGGLVEELNLRTTILRSEDGAVHVFPNGSIQKLSNLTVDYSYCVLSVAISYQDDPDRAMDLLKEIAEGLRGEERFGSVILEPLDVMGVDQLGESSVIIKVRLKTFPMKQWMVGREMNRRIKSRFQEAGFGETYPVRTVHLSQTMGPQFRAELKEVVREVLREAQAGK